MTFESILIAVPTTSQAMKSATAMTLASVTKALLEHGRNVDLHNIDSAEIVTARDMFANMVVHSDSWDSLLFIDSDMAFDSNLILRMIALNEPMVGAAYIRRQLDLEQFAELRHLSGNSAVAIAQSSTFNVLPRWDQQQTQLEVRNGFASMAGVGMGCTLISRDVFIAMIDAGVVEPRLDLSAGPGKTCWSFFDNIIDDDGIRLGEDYSFCRRWTLSMGNKLWVCVDETLSHIGGFDYRARYADLLGPKQPAATPRSGKERTRKRQR